MSAHYRCASGERSLRAVEDERLERRRQPGTLDDADRRAERREQPLCVRLQGRRELGDEPALGRRGEHARERLEAAPVPPPELWMHRGCRPLRRGEREDPQTRMVP